MNVSEKTDLLIVGGGIIGLAHAYIALKKGYSVLLIEKESKAVGASVRNFGLIWPIGQPSGNLYERAMESREIWLELSKKANFWTLENGSMHLAYKADEMDVITEYHENFGSNTQLLKPDEAKSMAPTVIKKGLLGGLYSKTELNVNPKRAIYAITSWLSKQENCTIKTGEKVLNVCSGEVHTSKSKYVAQKVLICSGSDFQSLYPDIFHSSPLIKSKLQMLRTEPQPLNFRFGPTLCGGLTLRHYASFDQCQSLLALKKRIHTETPEFDKWGIHVMISQNEFNELIIGDSHEYGETFDPFDKASINKLILDYMNSFAKIPNKQIKETWHGVYAKHPNSTEFTEIPGENVKIITGFGGAGMTFSFGYAMEEISSW
jgi:D-hydroxyproline dehydrogenase subunit beta